MSILVHFRKSGARVLIPIYLAFSAVVLILVFSQLFSARNQKMRELNRVVDNYSRITEEALNASLGNVETTLEHLSYQAGNNQRLFQKDSLALLLAYKKPLNDMKGLSIMLINKDGIIVGSTMQNEAAGFVPGISLVSRDYFQFLKANDSEAVYVSDPILGKITGKWIIVLAKRVNDKNKNFLGVVIASIDVTYFERFKEGLHIEGLNLFSLVAGFGKKVMMRFPYRDGMVGSSFRYHPGFEPVVSGQLHSDIHENISTVDGLRRVLSLSKIGHYPMFSIIGIDVNTYLHDWYRDFIFYVSFSVLFILVGLVGLLRQIAGAEKIVEQQAKLSSSARLVALGEMAGSIGHEINNPLAVISGYLHSLKLTYERGGLDQNQFLSTLDIMSKMVERITKIISGLKKFSRQVEGSYARVRLAVVIDEALAICGERFVTNNIKLNIVNSCPEIEINANEVQLMQVFVNLLNNSFDAVSVLPEKWVNIEVRDEDGQVKVSITDSGNGIPKSIEEKIFEPFFTTKEIGKGTGLGLSIVKGIVESHGGKFWYDKNYPNTRFEIELNKG